MRTIAFPPPSPRRTRLAAVLLLAVAWPAAQATAQPGEGESQQQVETAGQGVDVYLSEDAMQALYGRSLRIGDVENAAVRVGFFYNEARDLIGIGDASVDVINPDRRRRWGLTVGPRAYGALLAVEDQDIFSIALGGTASYFFDAARTTSVSLTVYYAPDIVTFGNADNITDVGMELATRLTERVTVFVGYRTFEIDLPVDREVDDGLHLGFRGNF